MKYEKPKSPKKRAKKGLTRVHSLRTIKTQIRRATRAKKSIPRQGSMVKKPTRKQLIKKLDVLCSLIVRKKYTKCVVCGSSLNLQCGHLFSRAHYSTRWDFDNMFSQCAGCNLKHEYDPMPFYDWYKRTFGWEKMQEVYNRWKTIRKWKDWELQELLDSLQKP